ncbi:hypothetical protein RGQ29_020948 [Quercus rubra]|uniref:Heat shock 70 kDa protein 14 n=1 Tax=Quercus rubra TaxID=3512 RepID=A0AAN7IXV1_QUERU|nr:hypothetical protein RGQ29_020948 [Quercus rubra]
MMNPKNSISQIKRLIGRKYNDPELQRDLQSLPYAVTEGPDGYPLIHARYLGEARTFTPTQVLGMVLSNLKGIAEKNLNAAVVDCCIGIPVYFNELQRRAVLDAATIAGLHPLHLIHETTATALAYGIYKTDLPETDQLNVAFVDIGHASMQVCIAGFKKGQLKILAHSYDRSLGGRDFDEALFQHFAAKFKEQYKIDVFQNARACLRLRAACEKLKKMLSANPEAPLNIECLMDEKDVRGFIKRDEFEQISIPILERVKQPLEKALADAGLTIENVHMVEVVGSGSCVPAIIKILTEFFKKDPRHSMNASECVARGCALQCAILSPTFKVRDFQVNESFPFSVAFSWKSAAPGTQNGAAENLQSTVVFPRGNPIPSVKALTFYRSGTFSVDVQYVAGAELQQPAKISTYTVGPFQSTTSERAKLKVKVRLNLHGIVSVESATLLEEEDKPVQMEADTKVEAPKKVKKTNIPVAELVYGGMFPTDVQKAVEKEFEMALQDRVMEETKDRKNAVEAYIYDMRNKQGDPIEERYKESVNRGAVIDQLVRCVNSYREAAVSNDPRFDHIDISEKEKVLNECVEAEAWLREKKLQQDSLPKYVNPILSSADVLKKTETLDRFCKPIMTKPRPAPAKPATPEAPPTPPPQASEQQQPEALAYLLEEEEIEVPVSKEPAKEDVKMDTDEAPNNALPQGSDETDVNMQDAKGTADAPRVENGVPESGDKPLQMEADTKGGRKCKFFQWRDDEICECGKVLISEQRQRILTLETDIAGYREREKRLLICLGLSLVIKWDATLLNASFGWPNSRGENGSLGG